jgi:hypothetical protein
MFPGKGLRGKTHRVWCGPSRGGHGVPPIRLPGLGTMARRKHLRLAGRVLRLWRGGHPTREIARKAGCSRRTVQRILRKFLPPGLAPVAPQWQAAA